MTTMPDTRVVWRDRPATALGREAAAVVRAIGKAAGDGARLDAIEEIQSSSFVLGRGTLLVLASKYGVPGSGALAAIGAAPTDVGIDDDLDHADEVSASTGAAHFVNGARLYSYDKTGFEGAHKTAKKRADALIAAGTAPGDVYGKLIAGGIKSAPKHVTLAVPAWAPSKGPPGAAVTIQVFADFQCPFCARAMTGDFAAVVAAHPLDVRVVFREYPLAFHPLAEPAAEMAIEANARRGIAGFWRVHDALFAAEKSGTLTTAKMDAIGIAAGLDMTKVHAAQSTHAHKKLIDDDGLDAKKAGITGTPSFVVGDEVVVGAQPASTFEAAIRRQLAKKPSFPIK